MARKSLRPSPSYSITIDLFYPTNPHVTAQLYGAIAKVGGEVTRMETLSAPPGTTSLRLVVNASGKDNMRQIQEAIREVETVKIEKIVDRTMELHIGGKIEVACKQPLADRDVLSMAYTPGVARVCHETAKSEDKFYQYTIKQNCVAIVTDGTAVLGLGDIGPAGALPVMEGKAMLFKAFAGVDAFPICLDEKNPDKIVEAIRTIAPVFGGINLEDIAAPRCFEIEEKLIEVLDIPVFHDDQHGTAVVVSAALINALQVVDKKPEEIRLVVSGAGAAGFACSRLLAKLGVRDIVLCDRAGAIYKGRTNHMSSAKELIAAETNPQHIRGSLAEVLKGADAFLGVSAPGIVEPKDFAAMKQDAIVFALANPVPELMPEEAPPNVAVMATGRSDYPNQINNVLCFPGFFRGLLDARARRVTDEMKLAAARAIAQVVPSDKLAPDNIIPSVFDRETVPAVATAVKREAARSVARSRTPAPHGQ